MRSPTMQIKFEFTDGEKIVKLKEVTFEQRSLLRRMQKSMTELAKTAHCPKHPEGCHPTIMLNVGKPNYSWNVRGICCPTFRSIIETTFATEWRPSHAS